MNKTVLIIIAICSIIYACKKGDNIRENEDVYPESNLHSYRYKAFEDSNKIWIDSAYIDYKYKDVCNRHIEVSVPLSDSIIEQLRTDSLGIMKTIKARLQQDGISHFVGQIVTPEKLIIHFYSDKDVNPLIVFSEMDLPSYVKFQNDDEWGEYNYLLNRNMLRWPKRE